MLRNLFDKLGRRREQLEAREQPPHASATQWRERGNAALGEGRLADALEAYRQAAAADPRDALARLSLGFALLEQGDARAAHAQLAEALALRQPDQAILHDIHYLTARALRAQGDSSKAIDHYRAAAQALPTFGEAIEELVQVLHETGDHAQALEWAQRLRTVRPGIDADIVVAQQLHSLGRNDEALAVLDAALAREPAHAQAWTGRGNVLAALKRPDEAVVCFERALALAGPVPDALANSAAALARANRGEEALPRFEEALRLQPHHRGALFGRLNTLLQLVRAEDAQEAGRQALAAHPDDADIHWNMAIACLLAGRFGEGWREHEWRWKTAMSRARHPLIERGGQWSGAEDLQGRTILLFAEQGLGDSLQMLRYVPLVAARGARVLLHLPRPLYGLTLTSDLGPGVTVLPPGAPLPSFDFHCPLMSLPLAFGSDEATIPREVPYLRVDPPRVSHWSDSLRAAGGRLKVGLAWSGSATHDNDANRSIALAALRALDTAGCFFVSLQLETRAADRAVFEAWPELRRWGEELVDFDDTAALVQALDLVISVDTSVAHLAGALGRPLWVLLPRCPDWRWMLGRSDSPWYPSARLFRQSAPQNWTPVLAAARSALQDAVADRVPAQERTPAVAASPSWPELVERAQAECEQGQAAAALETVRAAEAQAGEHPLTGHVRGNALFALERYEEAAAAYEAALARKPDLPTSAGNAAMSWFRAGRMDRALARADDALRLRPDDTTVLSLRANALQLLGRHDEAIAAARAAHQKFPNDADLEWIYGAVALSAGDCEQGWAPLEARWRLPGAGAAPDAGELGCPAWTGAEPIEGRTLLLVGEQGFGDVFQFVRFAGELRRRGAVVVLLVREPVRELLAASMPGCTVVTRVGQGPKPDFHIAMMSLPGALGTTLATLPADVPYLRADPARVHAWRSRLPRGARLRAGIVWSGNPAQANDRNRSMALAQVLRIATPGVQLVNLQRDVREADREALRQSDVWDPSADLRTFSDTAALVETLDVVISVCTGVAHLAGAMGRPLWVLLAHRPDWRWLLARDDSPWYPTARLFRQPAPGQWNPVLDTVREELARRAATGPASA
ncbi:tetratricopeptide repeat protein [Ramlibacter sp. PS4R-6]|uniref:tetratricopeptide repeat protein n=1 Tax=Ramlibacter sp. PS4R-6 TaxID=3133438 RepID=UPI0030A634FE